MYKLIVVDDKRDVTEGIIKMGAWDELGFEVCGKAFNGEEALEIIKEKNPDVVITDIRMPKMDGIELTRQIKKLDSHIKVILLSGYDDFAYAQQAVKLGAEEYLLKPATINVIKDSVKKVKVKLDKEQEKKEEMALLNQKLIQSLPLLKDEYFQYLVSTEIDNLEQVRDKFGFLGINLDNRYIILMIVELDNISELYMKNDIKDVELYKFSIINIIQEVVSETRQCEVFRYQQNKIVVMTNSDIKLNQEENMVKTYQIAELIRRSVKCYLEITITIAIGDICPTISDIYYSFQNAQEALAYKLYLGGNRVITPKDIKLKSKSFFKYPKSIEKELFLAVKVGGIEQIGNLLEKYLDSLLTEKSISPHVYRKILIEFIVSVFRITLDLDDQKYSSAKELDYLAEFSQLKTIDEIKNWLYKILVMISQLMKDERKSQLEKDIENAKEYIYQHYNEDISLQKVANYICLSPTYFSTVFKERVGESFIEFLIKYRIEKAKTFLYKGQYKIYEVANMVGYSDRRYFSELFKKHTGQNPAEYAQSIKNNIKK